MKSVLIQAYEAKETQVTPEIMRRMERMILLHVIDTKWKEHLYSMDQVKDGISLRALGQRDPLVEYKKEGFAMFKTMYASINHEVAAMIFRLEAMPQELRPRSVFSAIPQQAVHQEFQGGIPTPVPPQQAVLEETDVPSTARGHGARAHRRKSRPQRPLSLRVRQKVQKMLRGVIMEQFESVLAFLSCLLSAGLLVLSFPQIEWSFLAWVALVPLLCVLDGQKPVAGFQARLSVRVFVFCRHLGLVCLCHLCRCFSVGGFFIFIFCAFWDDLCLFSAPATYPAYFCFIIGLGGLGIYPRPFLYRFWLGDAGAFAIQKSLAHSNSGHDRCLRGVVFGDFGQSFDF